MNSIPIHALVPEPVVSMVTSLLLLTGVVFPAYLINKRFNDSDRDSLGIFGFVLVLLGLINSVIYLTIHLQVAHLIIFRTAGILFMFSGLIGILYFSRKIRFDLRPYSTWFKSLPLNFKLIALLIAVLGFAYSCCPSHP
jgi:hypothetical protein